ncbi:hypothetical protein [Rhodococcus sp. 1168]|uniref:hypothetical protein n=1 Tax=Rhodococcus sp. 1168 TaxID=2018041 RepID=UPI000A0DE299|nr:hypothetical protein [Rhodococcus sp. 1168]ORI28279.1 hypothetical protein BJI47_03230 [Rhodococcus sp. 1168]
MKRLAAVALTAAVIGLAAPGVASADTGSSSTGSSEIASAATGLLSFFAEVWANCGFLGFTNLCGAPGENAYIG